MKATRAAGRDIPHTTLTVDDRDQINHAKGRALRLVGIVRLLTEGDFVTDVEVDAGAMLDMLAVIHEDLTLIAATFAKADARRALAGAR